MKLLKCECCGGRIVSDVNGKYNCEYCGMGYTEERIKSMVVSGTVETTVGTAEKERLLKNARYFTEQSDFIKADKTFKKLLFDFPEDEDVIKSYNEYRQREFKYNTENKIRSYLSGCYDSHNSHDDCFQLMKLAEEAGVDSKDLKIKAYRFLENDIERIKNEREDLVGYLGYYRLSKLLILAFIVLIIAAISIVSSALQFGRLSYLSWLLLTVPLAVILFFIICFREGDPRNRSKEELLADIEETHRQEKIINEKKETLMLELEKYDNK